MTNEFLLSVMGDVAPDLIERAEAPVRVHKKPMLRIALIAAVIALILTLCAGALSVAYVTKTVKRVEQTYPEYDGTVLHFVQIMLTEDENPLSSLLDEHSKQSLIGWIEALRRLDDAGDHTEQDATKDTTDTSEKDTTDTSDETESINPGGVIYTRIEGLSVLGTPTIPVFDQESYAQWTGRVILSEPTSMHVFVYGWAAFSTEQTGIYGYAIDDADAVYDAGFTVKPTQEALNQTQYQGGKTCSGMELLIPVEAFSIGEHTVRILVRGEDMSVLELLCFTVIVPDPNVKDEIPDRPPATGWSEGLEFTKEYWEGVPVWVLTGKGSCTDTELYIPPEHEGYRVRAIGRKAFYQDSALSAVHLPSTVTTVREQAFRDCGKVTVLGLSEGLITIGEYAFADMTALKQVTLPQSLQTLQGGAFYQTGLTQIIVPQGVQEVGDSAFCGCSLQSVELPDGLTAIGHRTFSGGTFTSFVVPEGVSLIDSYAFEYCRRMTEITLPGTLTEIRANAFAFCQGNIERIYFGGTPEQWAAIEMPEEYRDLFADKVVYEN